MNEPPTRAELRLLSQRRLEVLEAHLKVAADLPALVLLVADSADTEAALAAVQARYALSRDLAVAVLDMQVRRASVHERAKITEEHDELVRALAELEPPPSP